MADDTFALYIDRILRWSATLEEMVYDAQMLTGTKYGTTELLCQLDLAVAEVYDLAQKINKFEFGS